METYTKEQLIDAMTKYNQKVIDSPELFQDKRELNANEKAVEQINYLIGIIETGDAI